MHTRHETMRLDRRVAAMAIGCAVFLAAGDAANSEPPMATQLVHRFLRIELSPDAALVASVEGDSPPNGYYPPIRDLVIRRVQNGTATTVALPCGRVPQCWPDAPVWAPDGKHVTFALRTPGAHARSLYTVASD